MNLRRRDWSESELTIIILILGVCDFLDRIVCVSNHKYLGRSCYVCGNLPNIFMTWPTTANLDGINVIKNTESNSPSATRPCNPSIFLQATLRAGKLCFAALCLSMLVACSDDNNDDETPPEINNPPGSEGGPSTPVGEGAECSVEERHRWVYDAMHDTYLWYAQTPTLDYTSYADVSVLLDDLLYKPLDRFSFIMDEDDYLASLEGNTTAFGIRFGFLDGRYVFHIIEPGSPAGNAGIERGDEWRALAGIPLSEISSAQFSELMDTSNGPNTQRFTIVGRDDGVEREVTLTSTEFAVQTVFHHHTTETAGIKTGYLGFSRFMNTSPDELTAAFNTFKADGVEELILDLRYNGGGLIFVAGQLGGLIGGNATQDQTFAKIAFNDRYTDQDVDFAFTNTDDALNLRRVFVLTTANTCSASEMVINGLSPFVEVVVIGSASCGKPVGMLPDTRCDKALFAINLETRNAVDEGGFFDGFAPTCAVNDAPSSQMWDDDDALYGAARSYIVNNQCPASERRKTSSQWTTVMPTQLKAPDSALF